MRYDTTEGEQFGLMYIFSGSWLLLCGGQTAGKEELAPEEPVQGFLLWFKAGVKKVVISAWSSFETKPFAEGDSAHGASGGRPSPWAMEVPQSLAA